MSFLRLSIASTIALTALSSLSGNVFGWQNGKASRASRAAGSTNGSTSFLRVEKSADGELKSLQTAVTRYQHPDSGVVVDLIGAVHIGERQYYENLNELFTDYEALLYELVAPEGAPVPGEMKDRPLNPISMLQQSATGILGLESQLEQIDYTPSNFVHADLSPQQLLEQMESRGQTPMTLILETMLELMTRASETAGQSDAEGYDLGAIVDALSDPLRAKRMFAKQFADPQALEQGMGTALNQLLIADRNAAAISVLQRQMGSGTEKIGIFYGAAHMKDFDKRLTKELGFQRTAQGWLTAWDLTQSHAPAQDPVMSLLMQMMKELER